MTTTIPTTGPKGSPNKTGTDDAAAKTKAKAVLEAKAKKKERRKGVWKRNRKKKNNNNSNHMRHDGLITDGIMKGVIISPGDSAGMTTDFRTFKKSAATFRAINLAT